MIAISKKQKVEKVFNELFKILNIDYDDFNKKLPLTREQADLIYQHHFLDKHLLLKCEEGKYYITTFSLLNTVSKILLNQNMYFFISEDVHTFNQLTKVKIDI